MTQCPSCLSYNYSGLAWCTSCAAKDDSIRLRPWWSHYSLNPEQFKDVVKFEDEHYIHLKSGKSLEDFTALSPDLFPKEKLDNCPHPSYLPVPPSTASHRPSLAVLSIAALQHSKHLGAAERALAVHDFALFNYHLAQCNSIAASTQTP